MHVWIRVDGGKEIGMGHLVRTSSLGVHLLKRGNEVTYLTETPDQARSVVPPTAAVRTNIDEIMTSESLGTVVVDLPAESLDPNVELSTAETLTWYQKAAESLVVIDDSDGRVVCADVLVNPHIYADRESYEWTGPEPTWKLGGDYWIFDETIRSLCNRTPPWRDPPERALVTMGGSDVRDITPTVLGAFDKHDRELVVDVVVGPGFSQENRNAIDEVASSIDHPVRTHEDPDDLASLLFEADFAVSALGFTAYELLALQTPFVGVRTAPDQEPKAAALRSQEAMVHAETGSDSIATGVGTLLENAALRRRLRNRGCQLIDPDGIERVCDAIEEAGPP